MSALTRTTTLTVGELRQLLAHHDDDMPVLLQVPGGDYWHTALAKPVGDGEELIVEWSDYHDQYVVTDQETDEGGEWALILSV